jgi:hypothetical protein
MSGTSNRMKLEWHQCKMVRIGRPRLPVDALQKLMAKQTGEPVAFSMIVFGPMVATIKWITRGCHDRFIDANLSKIR